MGRTIGGPGESVNRGATQGQIGGRYRAGLEQVMSRS